MKKIEIFGIIVLLFCFSNKTLSQSVQYSDTAAMLNSYRTAINSLNTSVRFDASKNSIFLAPTSGNSTYSGTFNFGFGDSALNSLTTGYSNTAIGENAMKYTTTGAGCTAIGAAALKKNNGNSNDAFGLWTLGNNTTGTYNIGLGGSALLNNTTGSYNAGVGVIALYNNTTGSYNTGVGIAALYNNQVGQYNTAIGLSSLYYNTGSNNDAVGCYALYSNTTGTLNESIGQYSLYSNTTGTRNLAIGASALYANTTGTFNVAIGRMAGYSSSSNTTTNLSSVIDDSMVFIGNYATRDSSISRTTRLYNSMAIGSRSTVSTNNTVVIGNPQQAIVFGNKADNQSGSKFQLNMNTVPYTDSSFNMGSSTLNFKNMYAYKFISKGGTASKFVAGDGSFISPGVGLKINNGNILIDTTAALAIMNLDTSFLLKIGGTVTGNLTVNGNIVAGNLPNSSGSDSVVVWNSTTKQLRKTAASSISGTTPTLQQVTNAGNSTTRSIITNKLFSFGDTTNLGLQYSPSNSSFTQGYQNSIATISKYSSAVGAKNISSDSTTSAFGYFNEATAAGSSAFGNGNYTSGVWASAFGNNNLIFSNSSTAVGDSNYIDFSIEKSSAFGHNNYVSGSNSVSLGNDNNGEAYQTLTVGYNNYCYSDSSTSVGFKNDVYGVNSVAVGFKNTVTGSNSAAFGLTLNNLTNNSVKVGVSDSAFLMILKNGKVGIGTETPTEMLSVNGNIHTKKVIVTQSGWPDYVFDSAYKLKPLSELENFIKINKHLPEIPSESQTKKDGVDVGNNQALLLKKVEELTLYMINQQKQIEKLEKENEKQQQEIDAFKKNPK